MGVDSSAKTSNKLDRYSEDVAKHVIEEALPRLEIREPVLALLAVSIRRAHAIKDTSWGVTLHPEGVRLNVGPLEVFYFGRQAGESVFYLVADDERLSRPEHKSLARAGVEFTGAYKVIPSSNRAIIPLENVAQGVSLLRESYFSLLEKAARTVRTRMPWYEAHSPGVVKYLRSLGLEIEEPAYTKSEEEAKDRGEVFAELFREFSASYLNTRKGKEHLSKYDPQRAEARRNYEEILERVGRGEDVTDLVLTKLLPHLDSTGNRQRGAWIHVAQAVTKDVKSWFEGAGWTKPDDWPKVAEAVLRFIRRATESPSQLADACAEFAALPFSRGLKTGLLSPALNALRPDDYIIINSKSRKTINYFSGTNYSNSLTHYPALNDTGRVLIEELLGGADGLAGRVDARASDLFDVFSHWLVGVKKFDAGGTAKPPAPDQIKRYWKIAPGADAWEWDECRERGFIAIGWSELGDLSELSREEFEGRRDELMTEHPDWTREGVEQAWKFAQVRPGDRVVANHGTTKVLGVGTVIGPYNFVADARHAHRVPVRWDDLTPRLVKEEGWRRTLVELDREKFEAVSRARPESNEPPVPMTFKHPAYSLPECASETGMDEEMLARWVRAVERKGQAIIYGPPGTGKTFVAERLARHLVGGGDGVLSLVQFHPAYAYEDFIQGIRPQTKAGGGLDYPLVPGRFLDFCEKAAARTGTSVLIIDEINRANLARVFGELMYLLEYRDHEAPLAGGGAFQIPSGVRLIGTMNTADRSVALVDHALRRRFAFLHLGPNFEALRQYHARTETSVEGLVETLQRMNDAIADPHYAVGTSFFMRPDLESQIEDIWRMEIEPYIEEYFFDSRAKADAFRWDKVKQRVLG
jgi:MoxR-like ATPase